MNRIRRHAVSDRASESMQMASVFARLHFGYGHSKNLASGPRSRLTPISAGILLICMGAILNHARAQSIIPSSTATVTLQTLSPGSATFDAPAGTVVNTSAGNGVDGDNSQNGILTNHGSITGAVRGISLFSTTLNGLTLDNF